MTRTALTQLFGIERPVIQAPMAGATTPAMVIAVSEAGGLGSLPTSQYTPESLTRALDVVRVGTKRPINVNFFCHAEPSGDLAVQHRIWRKRLLPYYTEAGVDPDTDVTAVRRTPFDDALCSIVETCRPEIVSFHFGLPAAPLLTRVRRTGAKIISSATTLAEARWLADHGVDAIIAMGAEAGGHRGSFLTDDVTAPIGTMSLVAQIVAAFDIPVIAAGGIMDRRGAAAAFALGAAAVQVGTAYLFTPEASIGAVYRRALDSGDRTTAITNLFTGRPARGIVNRLMSELGALSDEVPAFPTAASDLEPLRRIAEADGRDDFSPLWAGQAFALATPMSAAELTRSIGAGNGD